MGQAREESTADERDPPPLVNYREPVEMVCQRCGVKHGCLCPRNGRDIDARLGR